jgi:hypothetical protein
MNVQEMEQGFQKIWELFQAWNIEVDRVYQRVKAHKNGDGLGVVCDGPEWGSRQNPE